VRLRVTNQPKPRDPVPQGELPPEPVPHWPGRHVDLPAGQVYVRSAPAIAGAEPAIFIHGLGGSSTNWTDLMDLLSRPVEGQPAAPVLACAAIDLPGFGSSPPASGGYSINAHAATVIQLIEEQGLGPVHLFGNSMGGTVSTRVAAARPDLVRTLALVSPAMPDLRPRPLPMRLALAALPGVGPVIMGGLRRLPAESRTDRALRDVYTDPGIVHPARRRAWVRHGSTASLSDPAGVVARDLGGALRLVPRHHHPPLPRASPVPPRSREWLIDRKRSHRSIW